MYELERMVSRFEALQAEYLDNSRAIEGLVRQWNEMYYQAVRDQAVRDLATGCAADLELRAAVDGLLVAREDYPLLVACSLCASPLGNP